MNNTVNTESTLGEIGTLVVITQTIERMLNKLLTFVIQDGTPLSYERLMQLDALHRKKTLGYFIVEMKKRAAFEKTLDEALGRFLANRNKLIHHFDEIPGHGLSSASDIGLVNAFLAQLGEDTKKVEIFCMALLHAWTEQTGIAKGTLNQYLTAETQSLAAQVNAISPQIDKFIFKKE